jgi:hypothetical protein
VPTGGGSDAALAAAGGLADLATTLATGESAESTAATTNAASLDAMRKRTTARLAARREAFLARATALSTEFNKAQAIIDGFDGSPPATEVDKAKLASAQDKKLTTTAQLQLLVTEARASAQDLLQDQATLVAELQATTVGATPATP